MTFLKKISALSQQIGKFENLTKTHDETSKYKQSAIKLAKIKELMDNYLLTASTTTMIKYDWKFEWWSDKPIQILGAKIKVLVCAGGVEFSETEVNTVINVLADIDFGGIKVSKALEKGRESSSGWHYFKGEIDIPKDFLSGEFKIHVSTQINNKNFALEKTSKIEGISNAGTEVLTYMGSLSFDKSSLYTYNDLKAVNPEGKDLNALKDLKQKIEAAIADVQNNMLSPAENLSSEAKTLLEKMIKEHPLGCKSDYNRYYDLNWNEKTTAYYNAIHLNIHLKSYKISDFTTLYISPFTEQLKKVNECITKIEAENAKMEEEYNANLAAIKAKSPAAGELVASIKKIQELANKYKTLKQKYPFLSEPEGTDAFKLVAKEKAVIEGLFKELEVVKNEYVNFLNLTEKAYSSLYKKNGNFVEKTLKKEAEEEKDKSILELSIFNNKKLALHGFLFKSVSFFISLANEFYKDFYVIWLDLSKIDFSSAEMSIKAYDPILDDSFEDEFKSKTLKNLLEYERNLSGLESTKPEVVKLTDTAGINPEDVQQGSLGDCYFLSGVEALARFDKNAIYGGADSIISGPDAKTKNYIVKLYVSNKNGGMKRVSIEVNPSFINEKIVEKDKAFINPGPDNITSKPHFAKEGKEGEIWVQLIEKALAQLEGSYKEVEGSKKDISLSGLEMLTGKKTTQYIIPNKLDDAIAAIIAKSATKIPMAKFGTKEKLPNLSSETSDSGEKYMDYRANTRLYAKHAYSLVRVVNSTKGSEEFELQNPHNNDIEGGVLGGKLIQVTKKEIETYFSEIEVS